MATVSGGIKINAAVSVDGSLAAAGSLNLYTAPATGYAIVNVWLNNASTSITLKNDGKTIFVLNGTFEAPITGAAAAVIGSMPVYVGPGKVLSYTQAGAGASEVVVTGVEFINL